MVCNRNKLKRIANKNIKVKLSIIELWYDKGIPLLYDNEGELVRDNSGEVQLDFFPKSLRDFYKWNGSQNCKNTQKLVSEITGTGTTTLDGDAELKNKVVGALEMIRKKAEFQLTNNNKTEKLKLMALDLELSLMKQHSVELKYKLIKNQYDICQTNLKREKRAHQQSMDYLQNILEKKEKLVLQLQRQLSEV